MVAVCFRNCCVQCGSAYFFFVFGGKGAVGGEYDGGLIYRVVRACIVLG